MVRRTILGEELILGAIGGSGESVSIPAGCRVGSSLTCRRAVTNGHQIDASETWINRLTEWFNTFMPPSRDYQKYAAAQQEKEKKGEATQEVWRTVRASEHGWKGINGAVPGESDRLVQANWPG